MRNHRQKKHPRDPKHNPEKTLIDMIAGEAVQRNHEGKMPIPTDDNELEHAPDTNCTDDSESGSCKEVHRDEEWV